MDDERHGVETTRRITLRRPGRAYSAAWDGLPLDVVETAARRIGLFALMLAIGFCAALTISIVLYLGEPDPPWMPISQVLDVVMIVSSALLFAASRSRRITPTRILNIGLAYEVLTALVIAFSETMEPWEGEVRQASWVAVIIVTFPLLVPDKPSRHVVAAMLSATMVPFGYWLNVHLGTPPIPRDQLFSLFFPGYMAAGITAFVAHVIYQLGRSVREARQVGSYELVEQMSKGGMGEVWRAKHSLLIRPAAIKLIRADLPESAEDAARVTERFTREARATAALRSPHTIELFDFGRADDGSFYYAMELLDGLDLDTLVERFGPVPAERAAFIVRQICLSLAEAHNAGLVHRDVKPANVSVCRMGLELDFVKVLDFGLVKSVTAPRREDLTLTGEGRTLGTPAFMAPEVVLGNRPVDHRADIYGVGCVAYWLVTGKLVFQADSALTMALQHVQSEPAQPSAESELSVPVALDTLIVSCLEKSPDDRPQSAVELIETIDSLGLADAWTPKRRDNWWQSHLPAS